ncbi:hypothetical protein [Microbispora sp. GKU 823]|uniref:hypothetical protein n=1 Tax=Microbispora sp. GKU 823 TaxID=1652100 RepID=UPI0015C443EE|nr:hypothetical protein [Microbispora sp. GKU 823]
MRPAGQLRLRPRGPRVGLRLVSFLDGLLGLLPGQADLGRGPSTRSASSRTACSRAASATSARRTAWSVSCLARRSVLAASRNAARACSRAVSASAKAVSRSA